MTAMSNTAPAGSVPEIVSELARAIVRRRLSAAAVFFLELHKPLAGLAQAAAAVSSPLLVLLVGFRHARQLQDLLGERDAVEQLICRIEALAAEERMLKSGG